MQVKILCASDRPYDTLMEKVDNSIDWFDDDTEEEISKEDALAKVKSGELLGFIDYRMFLKVSDFDSREGFFNMVRKRIEENSPVELTTWWVHTIILDPFDKPGSSDSEP